MKMSLSEASSALCHPSAPPSLLPQHKAQLGALNSLGLGPLIKFTLPCKSFSSRIIFFLKDKIYDMFFLVTLRQA